MIDLHYWTTPNGHKITIFLEEAGLAYKIHPVNLQNGDQMKPEFLKLNPNNKIPAIVDREPKDGKGPLSIFESGAILWYLAEKCGKFIPQSERDKVRVSEWLFWQVGGLGPMTGQNMFFNVMSKEKVPPAQERFKKETARLFSVLNTGLEGREYVAGEYSIADMAIYPWVAPYEKLEMSLNDYPNIKRWFEKIAQRPAVVKAYALAKTINPNA